MPAVQNYKEKRMTSPQPDKNITSVLKETRKFPPSAEFAAQANVNAAERDRLAEWAKRDPDGFWAEQAKSLHWFKPTPGDSRQQGRHRVGGRTG